MVVAIVVMVVMVAVVMVITVNDNDSVIGVRDIVVGVVMMQW